MGTELTRPSGIRVRVLILAIGMVIIGAFGVAGSALLLVPAWHAAHGGGVTGTFTLTEPNGCDRWQPPRQRCGWFGDFRSDDGKTVRQDRELAGGLPPGAQVGDTVPARDTGSLTQIYQGDDHQGWQVPAGFLAAFSAAFLLGIALLQPWTWERRLKQRWER